MWPLTRQTHKYDLVASEDGVEHKNTTEQQRQPPSKNRSHRFTLPAIITTTLLLASSAFLLTYFALLHTTQSRTTDTQPPTPTPATPKCPPRHEWRTLPPTAQTAYISALLCLLNSTSTLAPSSSRSAYDDFPWIHSHVGYTTHHASPFLPWHRYFLHIYESTLREKCGYQGGLVYWDWTLDAEAIEQSPVFDAETGFGGDGEVGGEVTVGRTGRCVVDGPFAGLEVPFYDVEYRPHCLSRGFRDLEGTLGHIDGGDVRPEVIEEVLGLEGYEGFVAEMEERLHDVIPFGVAGDFETFTAPYDPLFFLHHTQLDRLWWLWQQRQPGGGLTAYGGHKERHSIEMASLEDVLEYKGLAPDVRVKDVMDIEGDLLCYSYSALQG